MLSILEKASEAKRSITIYDQNDSAGCTSIGYDTLLATASEDVQLILGIIGMQQSKIVLLHFDNHRESIKWFWATVNAELLPAMSTPFTSDKNQREQHLHHLKRLLDDPIVLTSEEMASQYSEMQILHMNIVERLCKRSGTAQGFTEKRIGLGYDEIPAVIMLTSGSTGNAKAVPLAA